MNDILKLLDSTFHLISSIPVSGENVDVMAAARNNLRKIYANVREEAKDNVECNSKE